MHALINKALTAFWNWNQPSGDTGDVRRWHRPYFRCCFWIPRIWKKIKPLVVRSMKFIARIAFFSLINEFATSNTHKFHFDEFDFPSCALFTFSCVCILLSVLWKPKATEYKKLELGKIEIMRVYIDIDAWMFEKLKTLMLPIFHMIYLKMRKENRIGTNFSVSIPFIVSML